MKKLFSILILSFMCSILFGQNKEDAEKLVGDGIAYHDKGDYAGAIKKYDKALELDKDNLLALAEKAFSLLSLQKYDESVRYCKKAIAAHPGDKALSTVYVTYGNALDGQQKTDEALAVYDEGIKLFPDFYQLHFNKGIALSSAEKYDEAITCFEASIILNPQHASSHNAIARLSYFKNRRIPSLMAYCRFLVVEPESERAKENLANLQKIMKANVQETGKKSITISISPDILGDTAKDGKPKENSFTSTDMILSFASALDFDKKNKKKTDVEQFIRKMETVCSSLKETKEKNYGFFWDYYVPYFIEMKDQNHLETFSYIAFASSDEKYISKWLKTHKSEIDKFFKWSQSFEWKSE